MFSDDLLICVSLLKGISHYDAVSTTIICLWTSLIHYTRTDATAGFTKEATDAATDLIWPLFAHEVTTVGEFVAKQKKECCGTAQCSC